MKRRRLLAAGPLLALAATTAWGCGVCVEDKVAATYDHAVLQRAAAAGHLVVYCGIDGPADAVRLRAAAARVGAIDRGSVRVAAEPAAVSFALDPAQLSPQAAVVALQRAVQGRLRIAVLRVADPAAGR